MASTSFRLSRLDGTQLGAAIQSPHIQGLDAVRAAAVLFVLIGHGVEGVPIWGQWLGPLSSVGVKLFFVLSGLLITRLLLDEIARDGTIHLKRFYVRRIARLMPAFYLYLLASVTILLVRGKPVPWGAVTSAILYVTNYYQAAHGAPTNIVSHCWSLAVEEQFYMIWPLALSWLFRKRWPVARVLVTTILCIWLWRLGLTLFTDTGADYLYRALDTRGDELSIGCLLAVYMRQATWQERLARWLRAPLVVPVMLALFYASSVMHGGERLARFGIAFMVDGPLIAMLILSASAVATFGQGWAARLLRQTTLVSIGRVSYFMYLFHGMIMYTTANLVVRHTGSFWLGLVTALVAVYAVARLSFAWIETPARLWITRQAG